MVDPSLTNQNLKTPDFKVSTRYFDVEHAPKWGRLGECDDYFWKTKTEKEKYYDLTADPNCTFKILDLNDNVDNDEDKPGLTD